MSQKYSPQEALQHYFEELLAEDDQPAIQYAEPDPVQQQKLEKLLQSAQPKIIAVPEPEVTAPVAEIQEWEILAPALETVAAPDLEPEAEEPEPGKLEESHYTVEGLAWAANGRPVWAQKD